ncbi:2-isopropylmalate synthase [hydrothermal vent metagenome]|uniref:2-isopropylmalate synthase n=1 Tax=hydrothermal vent metagenome TaxID=652676 RepID=A0A3B1CQA0_9ZZZZ
MTDKKDKVVIFDTTLRDGEQSPGFSMNIDEKLIFAAQLAKLKVDVIEAGFPKSSQGDFESVRRIAKTIKGPVICGLARALKGDIDVCAEALKPAGKKRIHTFIGASEQHLKYQMRKSKKEALKMAIEAVKRARGFVKDVEFSAMDASRTDRQFLYDILEGAIENGATTVNIPDTVGYAIPEEFGELIAEIRENVPNIDKAVISVHCHNDLGMAVANSLAAVRAGARQIECAVNGIGERAGNASLEEVVMAIRTRKDFMKVGTGINTKQIYKTSRLLISITGAPIQANKAIVGENAFAHESGIHQDGVLKKRDTFEIMTPASIGLSKNKMVLGKHSGRHAFRKRLETLGYKLKQDAIDKAFVTFKDLADKKKEIFDEDLEAIVGEEMAETGEPVFHLEHVHTSSGTGAVPTATIKIRKGKECFTESATGDGPVDAAFKAAERITGINGKLLSYNIRSVSLGKDAVGEATLRIQIGQETYVGKGASTDIIEASAKAWLNAINKKASEK